VGFASFQDLGMVDFMMSSLNRAATGGSQHIDVFPSSLKSFWHSFVSIYLIKGGVMVSNPGEDDAFMPEV